VPVLSAVRASTPRVQMEPYGAVQFGTIGMEYRPDRPAVGSNRNM
jgi:hypothetical protein